MVPAGALGAAGLVAALVAFWPRTGPANPGAEAPAAPWFEDATDAVGLTFTHDPGPGGTYPLFQIVGSGAALFDYDNDGRLDAYLLQNAGPRSAAKNRLFHQKADGTFEDVSAGSGLDVAGFGMGVAIGDVNNDGWPDVVLTEYRAIRLFLNNGNGTFTEVTGPAGLDTVHWPTSTSFIDFDRDGWLDLVVVQYVDFDPSHYCSGAGGRNDYCHPRVFPACVTRRTWPSGRAPGWASCVPTSTATAGRTSS
jgi:hypothetical protein